MKTKTFVYAAAVAGYTCWYRVNSKATQFMVGLFIELGNGGTGTYNYQLGYSDTSLDVVNAQITRSGTTATISTPLPAGGNGVTNNLASMKTGDSVVVSGAGDPFDGTFDVTMTAGVPTYTVPNSGSLVSNPGGTVTIIRTAAGLGTAGTTSAAYKVDTPCNYIRMQAVSNATGTLNMTVVQGVC